LKPPGFDNFIIYKFSLKLKVLTLFGAIRMNPIGILAKRLGHSVDFSFVFQVLSVKILTYASLGDAWKEGFS
jgi:hypothetical protein